MPHELPHDQPPTDDSLAADHDANSDVERAEMRSDVIAATIQAEAILSKLGEAAVAPTEPVTTMVATRHGENGERISTVHSLSRQPVPGSEESTYVIDIIGTGVGFAWQAGGETMHAVATNAGDDVVVSDAPREPRRDLMNSMIQAKPFDPATQRIVTTLGGRDKVVSNTLARKAVAALFGD